MQYQILVKFDDLNYTDEERKMYFSVVNKYHALAFGNSEKRWSTLIINQNEPLSKEVLAKDLGGLEILAFKMTRSRKNKSLDLV